MNKHTPSAASAQALAHLSAAPAEMCCLFVQPLLAQLDHRLDRRLVKLLSDCHHRLDWQLTLGAMRTIAQRFDF